MHKWAAGMVVAAIMAAGAAGSVTVVQADAEKESAYFGYGVNALKAGNLTDADLYFRSAADEVKFPKGDKPYRARALFLLALTYQEAGRAEDARNALAEAFQLDPSLSDPARMADAQRRFNLKATPPVAGAPATPTPERLAAAAPSAGPTLPRRPATTRWTGLVYSSDAPQSGTAARDLFDGKDSLRNNMPATAKDQLLRAIGKDPSLAEAHFWLAGAHAQLGDGASSRRSLARAYQLDPSLQGHEGELARFGSRAGGDRVVPRPVGGKGGQCDDLYATCVASSFRVGSTSGADFSRQATCTAERNQCYARNAGPLAGS